MKPRQKAARKWTIIVDVRIFRILFIVHVCDNVIEFPLTNGYHVREVRKATNSSLSSVCDHCSVVLPPARKTFLDRPAEKSLLPGCWYTKCETRNAKYVNCINA